VHWVLWSHGGNVVDKNDKVIINSPETVKALEYAKALSDTFVSGTASWNDAFNNKAFLESQVSLTNNGVSIYAAAKAGAAKGDAKAKEVMDDMNHSLWPVGPVGHPTEFHIAYPLMIMKYSKVPNACKSFIAFMMDAQQFDKWLVDSVAYLTHPLNAYDNNPVWKSDPKLSMLRDAGKRTLTAGGLGSVGEKAASALADFIVLDMLASVCTGRASIKDAISVAERQAKRIYR
jgi:multiple sugar transport system substrate-binding protein